ncbi:MAG: hypothetical protein H6572_00845 [Lewinellaceae bacterium]|nr:hypothetical protein [Lewinellaceae bacterium]
MWREFLCGRCSWEASELVHFRKRIGETGYELFFKRKYPSEWGLTVCCDDHYVNVDTTVQEKSITFPTDSKLTRKS